MSRHDTRSIASMFSRAQVNSQRAVRVRTERSRRIRKIDVANAGLRSAPVGQQSEKVRDVDGAVTINVGRTARRAWFVARFPSGQQHQEVQDADRPVPIEVARIATSNVKSNDACPVLLGGTSLSINVPA